MSKPFNLEEAKAGKPVQLTNGDKARIICFDRVSKTGFSIVVLIDGQSSDGEGTFYFNEKGKSSSTHFELCMTTEKKSGWINIYPPTEKKWAAGSSHIHPTRESADSSETVGIRLDCIPVNWEE